MQSMFAYPTKAATTGAPSMEQYPKISRLAVLLPAGEETVEGAFDVIVVGLGAMGSSAAYHFLSDIQRYWAWKP